MPVGAMACGCHGAAGEEDTTHGIASPRTVPSGGLSKSVCHMDADWTVRLVAASGLRHARLPNKLSRQVARESVGKILTKGGHLRRERLKR